LAWARAFASAARQPADLEWLRGWLIGQGVPPGLAIDTELRWSLVGTLVAEEAAGAHEIDAELVRDCTTSGARAAATARALLPTPESKAETWRQVTAESVPNSMLRALLRGFYHPSHLALTRPFAPAYFAAIERIRATRDNQDTQDFLRYGYPVGLVDRAVVDLANAWLADASQPPAVRRLVKDGRDGQVRALAARARDAAAP
jgi:aminopeptidase N